MDLQMDVDFTSNPAESCPASMGQAPKLQPRTKLRFPLHKVPPFAEACSTSQFHPFHARVLGKSKDLLGILNINCSLTISNIL
jgi:hypothetical protein